MVWRMREMPAEERKMAAVSFEATRGGGAGHQAGGETGGENRRRERRLCFSRPRKKKVKPRVVLEFSKILGV